MKTKHLFLLALLLGLCSATHAQKKYKADWESLSNYKIPTWFKDAKLGIFIHWGPASVPGYGGWYGRNMYMMDSTFHWGKRKMIPGENGTSKWHKKNIGDQKEVGYKDLIPKLTAEKFNAEDWISLFKEAGAKYVVPVATHHDSFAMYDSKYTKWKATNMGPKRDILGELLTEARKQGLHTGASSHLAFHWNFFRYPKGYDTSDPKYADLYGKPNAESDTPDKEFLENWWKRTKDIIDNYQPEILWFDFFSDKPAFKPYHTKLASYYYNKGLKLNKEFVLQTKNYNYESFPAGTHVLDLERGLMSKTRKHFWQTDTSIGENAWFFKNFWKSRTPNSLIDDFVDIVSKNGSLLLNIGPKADGTIPQEQVDVLKAMGAWLKVNGEAIYGTRPWKVFGEGPTKVKSGHKTERGAMVYTSKDIRFTQNGNVLYAIALAHPENEMIIKTLASDMTLIDEEPVKVELLETGKELEYKRTEKGMVIQMPSKVNSEYATVVKITFPQENGKLYTPEEEAGTL